MPSKRKTAKPRKTAKKAGKHGRPSTYDPKLAERIIAGLSQGIPLTVICRDMGKPGIRTVYDWMDTHPEFSASIARARDLGYDAIAAECMEIANNPLMGIEEVTKEWGTEISRRDMLGHRKLQIETRLKLLAKWDPKRYGERMATEISGPDGGPIQTDSRVRSDDEKSAFAAQLAKVWKAL
jgi:hypothetical protein